MGGTKEICYTTHKQTPCQENCNRCRATTRLLGCLCACALIVNLKAHIKRTNVQRLLRAAKSVAVSRPASQSLGSGQCQQRRLARCAPNQFKIATLSKKCVQQCDYKYERLMRRCDWLGLARSSALDDMQ